MNLDAILGIAGAGSGILGGLLGARAQGKANDANSELANKLFGLATEQENLRRQLMNGILPNLNRSLRLPPGAGVQALGAPPPSQQSQASQFAVPNGRGGSSPLKGAATGGMLGMQFGGPVGAVAGAGIGAVGSQIGKLGANESRALVNNLQNPFHKSVAGVIDPYNAAKSAGTLTAEQQKAAQAELERLIAQYMSSASQYSGQGKKQNAAYQNSLKTLNPLIESWRQTVNAPLGG